MTLALPVLGAGGRGTAIASRPDPAPAEAHTPGRLFDSHGRTIRDLRLSITDRCNFRCIYCLDPDAKFLDRSELLSAEELIRVARVAASMGVRKIRLTGGEPTLHPRLIDIIRGVSEIPDVEIALTTNGSLVDESTLHAWRDAGLNRLTVSIDSLRPERFASLTRSRTTPEHVMRGAAMAVAAGLTPVKLNAVLVRGFNEDEAAELALGARDIGAEMRFIEFMPLDSSRAWNLSHVVTADEIIESIRRFIPLRPIGRDDESGTALNYEFADGRGGRFGVIAPVSRPFCGACSRLRITADGKVRPCLFSTREWDLRPVLRGRFDDDAVRRFLVDATWTKQAGHGIATERFARPERSMSAIGG